MSFKPVDQISQENRNAGFLHDYAPKSMRQADGTLIPVENIQSEGYQRAALYLLRQGGVVAMMCVAPGTFLSAVAGGAAAGLMGGMLKECRHPTDDTVGKQWRDWFQATAILTPGFRRIEKVAEGVVAVANVALAIEPTGGAIYNGIVTGASHGWTLGKMIAQCAGGQNEEAEPAEQSVLLSKGGEGSHDPGAVV